MDLVVMLRFLNYTRQSDLVVLKSKSDSVVISSQLPVLQIFTLVRLSELHE